MRDAANLAWKLAAIVNDGAPDALLDSYESERRPHVAAFIELAVRLGAVLQETDPAAAAERDRRFEAGAQSFDFPQPQLGPGARLDGPPPVGTIFPQPQLSGGRLMDAAIGARWAMVGDGALMQDLEIDAVRLPGVGLDWLDRHGVRAAILRPDCYVFAVARDRAELAAAAGALAKALRPA